MFKKLLALVLIFVTITSFGSSKWKQATQASFGALNDVYFISENVGWIVGSSGTVLKTIDGGLTWTSPTSPYETASSLYSVFFVDDQNGFAGGYNDMFLVTKDGGDSWTRITTPSVGGDILSIYFADLNTGWILSGTGGGGQVLYTSNGGKDWTSQMTEVSTNLKVMRFSSKGHGICIGGRKGAFALYYTKDGENWTKVSTPSGIPPVYSRTDLYGLAMANDDVAVATGWGSSAAGLQPAFTFRTTDGGETWEYMTQAEENRLYNNMYGIDFKNETSGIAVGGSSYKGTVAYKTNDAGITWQEAYLPTGFTGKAISIVNDKICVVGSGGGIAISDDYGTNWKLVTPIITSTLYDIEQLPNNKFLVAGFYGGLLLSDDGSNWRSNYIAGNNICPTVEDIFFLNDNIGYAAQRNRTVAKTTDGGETWTQIMKDTMATSVNNYGVQFLDENIGFVVGKFGSDVSVFYKTTDGGATWSSLIADVNLANELNSLHFFDANNGVVCGDGGALAYTEDGGATWTRAVVSDLPDNNSDFNAMKFANNNFGIAGGKYLIKTSDGGKNWKYVAVPDLEKSIEGIEIVDESTWYLSGSKYLFKTTDGGASWSNVADLDVITAYTNYDVLIDSEGYPWVACGSSEIYTVAPIVDVIDEADGVVKEFSLSANYPNPFNPTTKIQYSIPSGAGGNVTLKVFDLLGKEVATLVNKVQKSGTYEVQFDAKSLTSGIYIYNLQYSGKSVSRKMVVLK